MKLCLMLYNLYKDEENMNAKIDGMDEKMDSYRRNLMLAFLAHKRSWKIIIKKTIFRSGI